MKHIVLTACLLLVMALGASYVRAATYNTVPKYAVDGSVVDSSITESAGNVGIGTTNPGVALAVNRSIPYAAAQIDGELMRLANTSNQDTSAVQLSFQSARNDVTPTSYWIAHIKAIGTRGSGAGSYPSGQLGFYTTRPDGESEERLRITSGGNVGIGTTNPGTALAIERSMPYTAAQIDGDIVRLANTTNQSTSAVQLSFQTARNDLTPTNYWVADIKAIGTRGSGAGAYPSGQLVFYTTRPDGESVDNMRIIANGNVGIGTAVPATKLHVAGDVRVDGNIAAKYQDVAEWVDSAEPLAAGTIVVIDSSTGNRVTAATRPYDPRVAGVVSAAPGVALGEPGRGRVLVAQNGRVRIDADASYGPIQVGDLLVSSPTKGAAMRSEPIDVAGVKMHRPGTLIGKALESLDAGTGEILVLLTLQ